MDLIVSEVKEIKGDLFTSPDSLAHCVSKDLKMGAGIAVIFKKKFGQVEELMSQNPQVGGLVLLKEEDRTIFYLVTKEKYWYKPTYKSLESSLVALNKELEKRNIFKLSIPRIGCGLDNLNWEKVKIIIGKTLPKIIVNVYHL